MKKTLFFGLIAAALGFTACSSEDDAILGENIQKKGMVLNATIASDDTRATMTENGVKYDFAFATDDVVKVTNSAITNKYYTFTNDGTTFSSSDATPTASAATWYAYFPSEIIDLTNQEGTLEAVANKYAVVGTTASATTGEDGLSISMSPKVAILKIDNQKGSIDISAKLYTSLWLKGMTASKGNFDVAISTSPVSLFSTTTVGTYYVAVPAGVQLAIKDGNTVLKSTKAEGLAAGKYYNLTVGGTNPHLLPGSFTVNAEGKKVKFTKSNLYWDGSAFHFEAKPTDYPTTRETTHVGHFFWTNYTDYQSGEAAKMPYAASFPYSNPWTGLSDSDKFWCSENDKLTVEGVSGLYILSKDEWTYLLNNRDDASTKKKPGVTVTDGTNSYTNCLIIAPDDFTGTIATSYTLDDLDAAGLVCLPAAGYFNGGSFSRAGDNGYYWSSTPNGANRAHLMYFYSDGTSMSFGDRSVGYSLRAVLAE